MAVSTVPTRALTSIPLVLTGNKITRWFYLICTAAHSRSRVAPGGALSR